VNADEELLDELPLELMEDEPEYRPSPVLRGLTGLQRSTGQ